MMKKAKVIAKTADHEALIKLIQAAKEDHDLYQQLTHLLKQNNRNRIFGDLNKKRFVQVFKRSCEELLKIRGQSLTELN